MKPAASSTSCGLYCNSRPDNSCISYSALLDEDIRLEIHCSYHSPKHTLHIKNTAKLKEGDFNQYVTHCLHISDIP